MKLNAESSAGVLKNNIEGESSLSYLCPLSGCMFTSSTNAVEVVSQHLETFHHERKFDDVQFIELSS